MNYLVDQGLARGFGTYPLTGETLARAIEAAVQAGYRAFDTAQGYGNEADTGATLAQCGIPRDRLFITTKVRIENFAEDRFIPSVEESLKALRLDRVDLLLLHWPPIGGDVTPSLRLLQKALDLGLTRHIGVSNYNAAMMRVARDVVEAPLLTNQVEFHPLLDQAKLLAAAAETGIPLSSYCSLARGAVFQYPQFGDIGTAHGKSAAQVALRWILQKGLAMNTMSTKPENIRANFEIMDFALSPAEMARIDALNATGLRLVTGARVPQEPDWR